MHITTLVSSNLKYLFLDNILELLHPQRKILTNPKPNNDRNKIIIGRFITHYKHEEINTEANNCQEFSGDKLRYNNWQK